MMTHRISRHSGFTMLEIMLVVTIIVLLLGAGIAYLGPNLKFSQDVRVQADIRGIGSALKLYRAVNGILPTTEQGIKALVTRPTSEPRPKQWRQFLDQVDVDPWQQPYEYVQPGKHNPDSFDLFSKGPDLKAGTPDDIGNWGSES